jgi:hypothetical protein
MVGPKDFRTMGEDEGSWHLVAWNYVTEDLELISSGDAGMRTIAVAPDLLAAD